MEVDAEVIQCNILKAMQHPHEEATLHLLNMIDDIVVEAQVLYASDALVHIIRDALFKGETSLALQEDLLDSLGILNDYELRYDTEIAILCRTDELLHSVEHALKVELKQFSEHHKYIFLGDDETMPVIIKKEIEHKQEARLSEVLR